jgi:hypothetical protein
MCAHAVLQYLQGHSARASVTMLTFDAFCVSREQSSVLLALCA